MKMLLPDLRIRHDELAYVQDGKAKGVMYRHGLIIQTWWETDILGRPFDNGPEASRTIMGCGRETWDFTGHATQSYVIDRFNELKKEYPCQPA